MQPVLKTKRDHGSVGFVLERFSGGVDEIRMNDVVMIEKTDGITQITDAFESDVPRSRGSAGQLIELHGDHLDRVGFDQTGKDIIRSIEHHHHDLRFHRLISDRIKRLEDERNRTTDGNHETDARFLGMEVGWVFWHEMDPNVEMNGVLEKHPNDAEWFSFSLFQE